MQLTDKKVLVFGAGKSGISASSLLQKLEAFVILFDSNTTITKEDFEDKLDINYRFRMITGAISEEVLNTLDLTVISPGVSLEHPEALKIKNRSIPIWGEIELAYRYSRGKTIGITGTNGKTTTTTLIGKLMKSFFEETYVVGNIGNAYSDIALNTTDKSVAVIEVSSFQLETIHRFRPDISLILNITPDHMDRHHTMKGYIAVKERITMNQTDGELCILNYEDEILRTMAERVHAKVLFFSSRRRLEEGMYLEADEIYYSHNNSVQYLCSINDLHVLGRHNYENIMAAAAVAINMGLSVEEIRKVILNFKAVEHRIEYVETIRGVAYYNDSKGTNPDASMKAIYAMKHPVILIAGGYDKKVSFDSWVDAFDHKVKCLILIGNTRKQIAKTAKQHGFHHIIMADSLQEAVRLSAEESVPGDVVLLSPACASWGMFENFEQRGNQFKKFVREMM